MSQVKEVLNPQELADLLGLKYGTVLDFVKRGLLPGKKLGGLWVFHRQAVMDYLYFGSLGGLSPLMEHHGIDIDRMMRWINDMRNHRDKAELELVKTTKAVLTKLREGYISQTPPEVGLIKELEGVLDKVEVFQARRVE